MNQWMSRYNRYTNKHHAMEHSSCITGFSDAGEVVISPVVVRKSYTERTIRLSPKEISLIYGETMKHITSRENTIGKFGVCMCVHCLFNSSFPQSNQWKVRRCGGSQTTKYILQWSPKSAGQLCLHKIKRDKELSRSYTLLEKIKEYLRI